MDSYEDAAVQGMSKNEDGVLCISTVTLNPRIVNSGAKLPTPADEAALHEEAHEQGFIANSIKTQVTVR